MMFPRPLCRLLALAFLATTLPCAAQSRPRALMLSVPSFAAPFWIYLDGQLVASAPRDDRWRVVDTPNGFKVYSPQAGLVVQYEGGAMTRLVDPAAATREHLFQRFTFSATDGSHAIDVLYYQPRAASADLPFPFRTTHLDLTADAAPRTTPIDLPAGWENPSIDAAVPTAVVSVCAKGDAPPDIDQLRGMVDTYMHNPVVAALHAASPPTTSGARRVVTLSLPPAIGGARPFDADQIHAIAGAVRSRLGERLPIYKPDSLTDEGYPFGPPCITRFPDFATSYQAAMALTERVRNDMDSLDALAP